MKQRWLVPRIVISLMSIGCTYPCWGGEVRFFAQSCDELLGSTHSDSELYERTVAQSYLNWRQNANESVLLASKIDGWHIPAFDGVIEDTSGNKIADLSIKGIRVVASSREQLVLPEKVPSTIRRVVREAARMTRVWSEEPRWDTWMKYSRAELDQLILSNPSETLLRRKRLLATAINLFSIPLSRSGLRTRVVVAITDASGQLQDANEEQIPSQTITNILDGRAYPVESVTILSKNRVWNFEN